MLCQVFDSSRIDCFMTYINPNNCPPYVSHLALETLIRYRIPWLSLRTDHFPLVKECSFKILHPEQCDLSHDIRADSPSTFTLYWLLWYLWTSLLAEQCAHWSAASILLITSCALWHIKRVIFRVKKIVKTLKQKVPCPSRHQLVNKYWTAAYCHLNGSHYCHLKEWCLQGTVCFNRTSLRFSQSQITLNGNSGGTVSPLSYYQRPFSPSAYSLPGSFNSSITMQHGRSLGKSSDNHDFHVNFNITGTNQTRKI